MADDLDALYALSPEEFTAARDRLAASLRSAGDRDDAAEVKKLRRPTVTAWALNQLVRAEPDRVRELVEAGDALRAAQRRAASGTKDSGFRDATARRRELVQALTRAASEILAGRGGAGGEEEIARTLETASVDAAAAEEVLAGRLARPILGGSGFEAVTGFEVVPDAEDEPSDAERQAHEVAVRNAERQAAEAEADAKRAAMRAEHLAEQAEQASQRAEEARAETARLEDEAARARDRLESLRHEAP